MKKDKFTVATIQASPVFMDLNASIDKACKLIKKAAKEALPYVKVESTHSNYSWVTALLLLVVIVINK